MIVARTISVSGLVQGVGYRQAMVREARRMGVKGWVRNRLDGSVEAFVQGEPVAIEDILQWSRLGPPSARVDHLSSSAAEPDPAITTFERRDTA